MAGSAAYRLELASSASPARRPSYSPPQKQSQKQPPIQVMPGKRGNLDPSLSDSTVAVAKTIIMVLVVFLIIGFVRVGLASAAYTTASQATALSAEIADVRSSSESLSIQKSLLVTPNNLKAKAKEKLNMTTPKVTEVITLPPDIAATDASGNLSFSQSVARLSQQG